MIFWTREIAGWLLVFLGLAAFAVVYHLTLIYRVIELIPLMIIGIFLFRGGIQLIKVAVAARICREAQDRLYPDPALGALPLPSARIQTRVARR